jgi:uncharacterized protein
VKTIEEALPIFAANVVGFGSTGCGSPYLIGGHCPKCDRWYFPRTEHCRHCHEESELTSLGSLGTVYSCTVVRIKPPLGFPSPYAVAYVDLRDKPLRVFMLIEPASALAVRIGQDVELAVDTVGVNRDGAACLRPFFRPIRSR